MRTYSLQAETSRKIHEQEKSCLDYSVGAEKGREKEGAGMVRGREIDN